MARMLDRLKVEALVACGRRGHRMKRFHRDEFWGSPYAECRDCGALVGCRVNPLPNQTNISGEAVAVECAGRVTTGEAA